MSDDEVMTHVVPFIKRLVRRDWWVSLQLSLLLCLLFDCCCVADLMTLVDFLWHASLLSRFTARASASSLLHIAYPRVNDETKTVMFNSFIALCKDETPLVRRIAADNVAHWTEWASTIEMQNELITILKTSIVDEQVSFYFYLLFYCEIIVKMLSYEWVSPDFSDYSLIAVMFPQCFA